MNSQNKLTFLVIDDAMLIREILKEMIEVNLGHKVVGLGKSGQDAITMYRRLKPDIVTLDISMPGMDGNQALKVIKEINVNAKVVMMTSRDHEAIVKTSIKLKADGYLLKPFTPTKLYNIVIKLFPDRKSDYILSTENEIECRDDFCELDDNSNVLEKLYRLDSD